MKQFRCSYILGFSLALFILGCEEKPDRAGMGNDVKKMEAASESNENEASNMITEKKGEGCYFSNKTESLKLATLGEESIDFEQLSLLDKFQYVSLLQKSYYGQRSFVENLALKGMLEKDGVKFDHEPVGISFEELIGNTLTISDEEIKDFYEKNKNGFPKGSSLKQLSPVIKKHIAGSKAKSLLESKRQELFTSKKFSSVVSPPCPPAIELNRYFSENEKIEGKDQVIYKGGFFCPQCRIDWPQIYRVLLTNQNQVSFHHLPSMIPGNEVDQYLTKSLRCIESKKPMNDYLQALKIAYITPIQFRNDLKSAKSYFEDRLQDGLNILDLKELNACLEEESINTYYDNMSQLNKEVSGDHLIFINGRLLIEKQNLVEELSQNLSRN